MGELPLQPRGDPPPPAWRRTLLLLALAALVLALGWLAPARPPAPRLLLDGPDDGWHYARAARRLIDRAERRVWMAMYVVRPDDGPVGALLEALAAAAARGVEVRVWLDDAGEREGVADAKHEAAAAWLAARGVAVLRDEASVTTHAKVLVVDGRWVLAGSHNWTYSALARNRELSWLVEDPAAAARVEAWLAAIPGR